MGFAFEGVADDYARQTVPLTLEVYRFLSYLKSNLRGTLEGKNPCHEKAFNGSHLEWLPSTLEEFQAQGFPRIDKYTDWWMDFQDFVSKGRVWISTYAGTENLQVQLGVVLKTVWEHMITDLAKGWQGSVSWAAVKADTLSELEPLLKTSEEEEEPLETWARLFRATDVLNRKIHPHFIRESKEFRSPAGIVHLLTSGRLDPAFQLSVFCMACEYLDIYLLPPAGYSQDYGNQSGKDFLDLLKRVSKPVRFKRANPDTA
jgi:hypothetical protein